MDHQLGRHLEQSLLALPHVFFSRKDKSVHAYTIVDHENEVVQGNVKIIPTTCVCGSPAVTTYVDGDGSTVSVCAACTDVPEDDGISPLFSQFVDDAISSGVDNRSE